MKNQQKIRRQTRIRKKIQGTKDRPRLSIFRSNRYIFVQLIDDENGKTILGLSDRKTVTDKKNPKEPKSGISKAKELGILIAKKALEKDIKTVSFDKGSYAYHGRVKSLAEGAREGGLKF